jgi:hypothetical protein
LAASETTSAPGPGERGDDAEVGEVAGGEHERRTRAHERGELGLQLACSCVVPVTSREPVEPAPQARVGRDRALDDRGSVERPR